jgi:hypothetical protein
MSLLGSNIFPLFSFPLQTIMHVSGYFFLWVSNLCSLSVLTKICDITFVRNIIMVLLSCIAIHEFSYNCAAN